MNKKRHLYEHTNNKRKSTKERTDLTDAWHHARGGRETRWHSGDGLYQRPDREALHRLYGVSRGAIRAMRDMARYAGFKIVKTIERGGTAMHPELTDKDKQKCRKAMERLS